MSSPTMAPSGYRAERYGPHEHVVIPESVRALATVEAPVARPGDFILTHSTGIFGMLIRFGESLRYWGHDRIYAHWSHAAIFVDDHGTIIEALGGGVQERNISVYEGTEYVVVHLPDATSTTDRQESVKFAEYCLNEKYGWLTIVSIALCLITGAKLSFGVDGQQICSALVARCTERIGEIFEETEPWHLLPADLAKHFNIQLIGEKGVVPKRDMGVIRRSRRGSIGK